MNMHLVHHGILSAISDLHAADSQYHHDCYISFVAKRNIQSTAKGVSAIQNEPKRLRFMTSMQYAY